MKQVRVLLVVFVVLLAGCVTQESTEPETPAEETAVEPISEEASAPEATAEAADVTEEPQEPAEPANPLADPDVVYFQDGTGARIEAGATVVMPIGGPPAGRLLVGSSSEQVTLYLTRDATIPSASNNWEGAIDPPAAANEGGPPVISSQRETITEYRAVAFYEGEYSEVVSVTIQWQAEEDPDLGPPRFVLDGNEVSATVQVPAASEEPVAESSRVYIESDYAAAELFITIDGSDPTPESFEYSREISLGTYVFSVEPGTTEYRVIARLGETISDVASITVEWTE